MPTETILRAFMLLSLAANPISVYFFSLAINENMAFYLSARITDPNEMHDDAKDIFVGRLFLNPLISNCLLDWMSHTPKSQ